MRDLLLIVITFILCARALSRPFVGALAFFCFGLFNPQSMVWGIGRSIPLSLCLAIATLIGYLSSAETKTFPWRREFAFLLLLWGIFCVTTFFAFSPESAIERLWYVSKIFLMVFLTTSLINSKERVLQLLQVIAFSLGLIGLKAGVWAVLSGGNFLVWGPEGSFLEANNSIGLALAMNVPLLLYLLKIEHVAWKKWLLRAMLIASYPAVVCTFSRGAWVGLFIATVFFVLRSRWRFVLGA